MAPDLTVLEYCKMLAERGDTEKLQQLSQHAYTQISFVVQQNQFMQAQENLKRAQEMQATQEENGAENNGLQMNGGAMPFMFPFMQSMGPVPQQFNGNLDNSGVGENPMANQMQQYMMMQMQQQ